MKRIYDIVRLISADKISQKLEPAFALGKEIRNRCPDMDHGTIAEHIRNLEEAGLVITGHTINDIYVKPIE